MTEIKILHIFGAMNRGGAEMRTLEVMRLLRPEGFIGDVLALSGNPGILDAEVEALGGRVHLLARSMGWRSKFRKLLAQHRYDVVHSHVHYYSGIILRESSLMGVRVRIAHFRNTDDGMGEGILRRVYRWRMKYLIDKFATNILAVSRATLCQAWPFRNDTRSEVICNGLDLARFKLRAERSTVWSESEIPSGCKIIINVANMTRAKNHEFIIRIFSEILKCSGKFHLVLVGHGGTPEETNILRLIRDLGLSNKVSLLGVRNDVPTLLGAADVFLFTSFYEGLPGALLEACASGLPCVVSDIAPCREIAERIPSVTCMSLDRPVSEWVDQIFRSLESPVDRDLAACHERLRRGGFDLESSAAAFRRIWTSVPAEPDQRR
jgi:glycosyltransferase involved in cell wall biosynthesis